MRACVRACFVFACACLSITVHILDVRNDLFSYSTINDWNNNLVSLSLVNYSVCSVLYREINSARNDALLQGNRVLHRKCNVFGIYTTMN